MATKVIFSGELDAELVGAVRSVAEREGKPVDSVMEEALAAFLAGRRTAAREHVMAKYEESLDTFGPLYERLAR